MNNENNQEGFSYTYSAKQMEEVKRIREKYEVKENSEDKMEKLRRLDEGVTKKGTVISLIIGIMGTLIMGTGMSMAMTDIAKVLGALAFPVGVGIGVAGLIMLATAYPIYNGIIKKEREKIAPEIIRLTDELMK